MSELRGQLELNLTGGIHETHVPVEGYDEQGHLINPAKNLPAAAEGAEVSAREADERDERPNEMRAEPPAHRQCRGVREALAEGQDSREPAKAERAGRLAVEINAIKAQTRGVLISAALEIGKRLIEAKALVPYGRWGAWLAENVDYSERRAQDMMRLFEEYGKKTVPQAIAELDYSKAVALLALPEGQRAEVAEMAAAEGLSTRELQEEIEKLRREAADRQVRMEELLTENDALAAAAEDAKGQLREEWETAKSTIQAEREAAERARSEAKAAGETAEALKKERDEAKKTRDVEIGRAKDAVKRANDTQKKLTEAEARIAELERAEPQRVEVERIPDDVAAELEKLRAAAGRSDAETRLRLGYERLTNEFEAVRALLKTLIAEDAEVGGKYAAAIGKAARKMAEMIEGAGGDDT